MKKWKFKTSVLAITSIMIFAGCSEKNEIVDDPKFDIAKVRYEASIDDDVNYKIRVAYRDENDSPLKEVIVESPFSYDMGEIEQGTYLYVSTLPVPRNDLVTPKAEVTSRIIINDKVHEEDTGEFSAIVQYVLGQ